MFTNQADLGFLNYLLAVFFEDTQDNNVLSVIVVCFVVRSEFGEYSITNQVQDPLSAQV